MLYHRASTTDQDPGLARAELRRAAESRGLPVLAEISETGSGANNDRPGLQRVLELARAGRAQAVITWKLDRFGRSALDLLTNLRELEHAGVRFIASSQGIDLAAGSDAISRLMFTMLSAIAEFERELIRERTRLGLQRARTRGRRIGRPPATSRPSSSDLWFLRHERKLSWATVAQMLGCSTMLARREYARLVKKGGPF